MAANGIISTQSWQKERVKSYNYKVQIARDELRRWSSQSLAELGLRGPGRMYKRPGMLSLVANGNEDSIPDVVACGTGETFDLGSEHYTAEMWYLVQEFPFWERNWQKFGCFHSHFPVRF
jgi:hypothetical protein